MIKKCFKKITPFLWLFLILFGLLGLWIVGNKFLQPLENEKLLDQHEGKTRDVSSNDLKNLRSLPYISWTEKDTGVSKSGVVKHEPNTAFFGYNLYTNDVDKIFLMGMSGKILHTWYIPGGVQCEYSEILANGDIVAVCVGQCFVKLDWDSNIIWTVYEKVHHDVAISRDGSYYVPFDGDFWNYNQRIVKFDGFLHISPNGEVLERWSVAENLKMIKQYHAPTELDEPPAMKEKNPQRNETYDYYHLNTIELLPETPLGKKDSRFQEGNYLLCLRNVSLIVILDKESLNVVWHWGPGILDWPHMPTMLENGNLLIFDNGTYREYSRVIEINPLTGEVVWEYRAKDFYSKFRGSSQRFPNGNTLICESEEGHVFEVTRHGKIVWEFYNPEIKEKKRKRIYRMLRYSKEHMKSLLKQRFREIEKLPF